MRFQYVLAVVCLSFLAGCDESESKFPEAYNRYMKQRAWGDEFKVHDVSCSKWAPKGSATNDVYTCDYKYMYLPWGKREREERSGTHVLLHKKGTESWWISEPKSSGGFFNLN